MYIACVSLFSPLWSLHLVLQCTWSTAPWTQSTLTPSSSVFTSECRPPRLHLLNSLLSSVIHLSWQLSSVTASEWEQIVPLVFITAYCLEIFFTVIIQIYSTWLQFMLKYLKLMQIRFLTNFRPKLNFFFFLEGSSYDLCQMPPKPAVSCEGAGGEEVVRGVRVLKVEGSGPRWTRCQVGSFFSCFKQKKPNKKKNP